MRDSETVTVWDPLVRLFHWSLVLMFLVTFITEDEMVMLHAYAGYLIFGLLLLRLIWGGIGTRYARFSDFVRPVREVTAYLKQVLLLKAPRYLGHNPAGGAMIVALLSLLLLTGLSGLGAYGAEEGAGPLALLHGFGGDLFEEVHEFFANFTLLLVLLHVAGVYVSGKLHSENLVRAMVTGKKRC